MEVRVCGGGKGRIAVARTVEGETQCRWREESGVRWRNQERMCTMRRNEVGMSVETSKKGR